MIRFKVLTLILFLVPVFNAGASESDPLVKGNPFRSVRLSVSRHSKNFANCGSTLLPGPDLSRQFPLSPEHHETSYAFPSEDLPNDAQWEEVYRINREALAPAVDKAQNFYFHEMQRRKILSPEEVAYYSELTKQLDPEAVSIVYSSVDGQYDSSLIVMSGQQRMLPFERQFRNLRTLRSPNEMAWEIGRARGGEFFKNAVALAALLMQMEAAELKTAASGSWIDINKGLKNAFVYIHATNLAHATLYQKPGYGFKIAHEVFNPDTGKKEFILKKSLKDFISNFKAYDQFDESVQLAKRLGVSAQKGFEIYVNAQKYREPSHWDYLPNRDHVPHYYPRWFSISVRTQAWKQQMNKLFQKKTGKSFEEIQAAVDFSTDIEKDLLAPLRSTVSAKDLFGTDNLIFVEGMDTNSMDAEDIPAFVKSLVDVVSREHAGEIPQDTVFVFRNFDESIKGFGRTLLELGGSIVRNPVPLRDQIINWASNRRLNWISTNEEERQTFVAQMYIRVLKMMGDHWSYFYKSNNDWPAMPDQLRTLSFPQAKEISKGVSDSTAVLFRGTQAQIKQRSTRGGF